MFEGIAKTNTTHTYLGLRYDTARFEGIAKTNTTHTSHNCNFFTSCLRVLLKQIQPTQNSDQRVDPSV